jgi:hypothetical protein
MTDLNKLLKDLEEDVNKEQESKMSELESEMTEIVRAILRLERDMTQPGSAVQETTRHQRLLKFIAERDF